MMEAGGASNYHLPEELMIESILTRLPFRTLAVCSIISKYWAEIFVRSYLRPAGGYIGHGFGFDSLSQVYKVVIIFTSEADNEFLCMVLTLGTMSWRKILTSIVDISPPPGSSPFPSPMVTNVSTTFYRQATFCRGDLFWRTKSTVSNGNDIEMLLSFDLHKEKIHFIQFPTECTLTSTPTTDQRQYLADDHLLEFKGYPCIAHSERITTRSNNDHYGHRCNYQAGVCCCCYKVHMYILKDKDKQVWTREETFNVQIMDQKGLLPTPLCCLIKKKTPFYRCFNTSVATPRTRILTFSDQVLLYWFNGERLILYNLQEKYLKAVECSRSYPRIFQTKMNEDLERRIGDDDNIYCPSMDYQLHAQVENIVSLETFIPKEAKTSVCNNAKLKHLYDNNLIAGWLTLRRKRIAYAFS
ncbi:uncharacterized protein LOC113355904 isoform X1 [Papaver somniferum]|uniref:uncharacterized protein LOC113355904 isoform X1 n=1 Tax=Papaver somniferum TaxID=3469 RepID=UPI000E6F86EF|nr:uncharacterized protein LOC113355904 isoform X1 [Papaver somniferum]